MLTLFRRHLPHRVIDLLAATLIGRSTVVLGLTARSLDTVGAPTSPNSSEDPGSDSPHDACASVVYAAPYTELDHLTFHRLSDTRSTPRNVSSLSLTSPTNYLGLTVSSLISIMDVPPCQQRSNSEPFDG